MTQLSCSVKNGMFSHERVVSFVDSAGEENAVFVDAKHIVHEESGDWLRVKPILETPERFMVSLPTADGDRVWVETKSLRQTVPA